jgi:signal transduction histidine kinase/ActR/RegA family two-component response regulator
MLHHQSQLEWITRNLIESLPAAVYVCAADASIVAFNRRAGELWGRTPKLNDPDDRYSGAPKVFHLDGTFLPHSETPMALVLRTGEAANDQEVIIERPDGSRVTVLVNIAPIFDEAGKQIGAVNCFHDLSAQRHSEQERAQLTEALRQSQKMEAVGQLTGGLAHDFNNLLAGISGSLEMMRNRIRQGKTNDLERYITAAQECSSRAAALTQRLLAFSRRQTLETRITDINRLTLSLEELIRGTVGPEIAVEVVAAPELWNTLVDPNQLENAVLNLCINARDAMPDGGRLIVETANVVFDERAARDHDIPPGDYVSLSVSDDGVGMTPDVARHAFEPFFTTKPIGMGTGLGLSMIYGFTRQSGGQVHIVSKLEQGTKVCLYLPRKIGMEDVIERPAGSIQPAHAEKGGTVLVIDDEVTVRMMVAEVLEDRGYIAIQGGDAMAGLRVLRSDARIDLLITDVGLPGGMNGRQLAEAARVHRPDLKVLFITGYAAKAARKDGGLDVGMHVMIKPFELNELAARVDDLIETLPCPAQSGYSVRNI